MWDGGCACLIIRAVQAASCSCILTAGTQCCLRMQVPAVSMVDGAAEGLNQHLIASINSTFEGSPEMCVTDTGIDDTLLSYVRSAVAPASHLKQFGWDGSWKEGDNADAPLDTMARLVDPIDFNTEAKVQHHCQCHAYSCMLHAQAWCSPLQRSALAVHFSEARAVARHRRCFGSTGHVQPAHLSEHRVCHQAHLTLTERCLHCRCLRR